MFVTRCLKWWSFFLVVLCFAKAVTGNQWRVYEDAAAEINKRAVPKGIQLNFYFLTYGYFRPQDISTPKYKAWISSSQFNNVSLKGAFVFSITIIEEGAWHCDNLKWNEYCILVFLVFYILRCLASNFLPINWYNIFLHYLYPTAIKSTCLL